MKTSQKYDHYYLYQDIEKILLDYSEKYKKYTKLDVLNKTLEGRNIYLLEITNKDTGDFSEKPAFYIEGNMHAGEVCGSMACMYFLDTIFSNLDNPVIKNILDTKTIYVLPRVSPDGAEYYLTTPNSVRSLNQKYPFSDLEDGINASDIDSDGVIRKMRIKSPYGIWKVSKKDPRLMERRKPDDFEGPFYNIFTEGEFIGGALKQNPSIYSHDFNRSYPLEWKPDHVQFGSGMLPLENVETKSNANFLVSHKNICLAIDMHTSGGQNLYTPGCKPSSEISHYDISLYKRIGQMATEENGFPCINVYDEFGNGKEDVTYGGFDDFCHMLLGIPCYTIECWDHAKRAGIKENFPPKEKSYDEQEEDMLKYLKWIDEKYQGKGFKNWTKFNHPTLGEVEIGGFDFKYYIQNPPIENLVEEIEKHTRFYLRALNTLPHVTIDKITKTKVDNETYLIKANILNQGFMSSYVFKEALLRSDYNKIKVSINKEVLDGKNVKEIDSLEGFSSIEGTNSCWGPLTFNHAPCEKEVSFLVHAAKGDKIDLKVEGDRIGLIKKSITI